ncbi:S8 family serine peptidase [Bradyrhizobium sp. UFLA05-153]
MAVTSANPARGRPTSWSAAVDQLCFEEDQRRLIILSAGNIAEDLTPADHVTRNDLEAIDDPAHAWYALTVGAYTEKVDIIDPEFAGYAPIAPTGELSPRSRTSVVWDRQWPVKPDVVFEGGNLAHDGTLPAEPIDETANPHDVFPPGTASQLSAARARPPPTPRGWRGKSW